jgi:hypothetical protein
MKNLRPKGATVSALEDTQIGTFEANGGYSIKLMGAEAVFKHPKH